MSIFHGTFFAIIPGIFRFSYYSQHFTLGLGVLCVIQKNYIILHNKDRIYSSSVFFSSQENIVYRFPDVISHWLSYSAFSYHVRTASRFSSLTQLPPWSSSSSMLSSSGVRSFLFASFLPTVFAITVIIIL